MDSSLKLLLISCFFTMTGCAVMSSFKHPSETVLAPGMLLRAVNENGEFSISYVNEFSRKFSWNGNEKTIRMKVRSERFAPRGMFDSKGYLGLYHPATGRGSVRLVVQEAERHFSDLKQMNRFIYQGSALMDWVYTEDGLMVGFVETPSRNQVNISLWQLFINGEKPSNLPNARPEKLSVQHKDL